jgi:acyl-CoA thioester hydrolase
MLIHQHTIRVRYAETDQMGVVYHGNYITYLEVGRVEYMRSIGFVYKDFEKEGYVMPVVHCAVDYKNPALYDDELIIETRVEELPTSKITFLYDIKRKSDDKLICSAKVILVFLNAQTFRPMKASEKLITLLTDRI